jgi:hypothetical protein
MTALSRAHALLHKAAERGDGHAISFQKDELSALLYDAEIKKDSSLGNAAFLLLRSLGYAHDAPDGGKPVNRIVNPDFPTTDAAAKRVLAALRECVEG